MCGIFFAKKHIKFHRNYLPTIKWACICSRIHVIRFVLPFQWSFLKLVVYMIMKSLFLLFFFFKSPLGAFVQIFGESCSADKAVLKMDSSQKEYIVKLHNRMRNRIAMGEIKKYSSAAKMPCFVSNLFEQILIEKLFKIWCESNLNAKWTLELDDLLNFFGFWYAFSNGTMNSLI